MTLNKTFLELHTYKENLSDFLNCSDHLVLSEDIFFSLKRKYIELWTGQTEKFRLCRNTKGNRGIVSDKWVTLEVPSWFQQWD